MPETPEQLPAPPVGEEIHMPSPSLLPIVNAFGISIAIIGLTISMVIVAIGLIVFLVSTAIWIGKARHEMDELPNVHHHS